jgi:hypothetical protein
LNEFDKEEDDADALEPLLSIGVLFIEDVFVLKLSLAVALFWYDEASFGFMN